MAVRWVSDGWDYSSNCGCPNRMKLSLLTRQESQVDFQICHSGHITQMCHILMWKVRWNIQSVARKEFRSGHCLCCAVSSAPAADLAPALLNLCSLITDTREGLAGDSCTLIHNPSWVKFAGKVVIFGVMYTWKKPQWSDSFLAEVFLTVAYRLLPGKSEWRFCSGNLCTILSLLSMWFIQVME